MMIGVSKMTFNENQFGELGRSSEMYAGIELQASVF